ncbi:Coenzyme F420 hydrogenase/dehydrogenase, beta subunit C-terminal domain [Phascolarctobacterium faecium]|uniref:Coenzyme F420 hydrogenase/dehydrogenase, beta subunit C-terminal domain n=1 Tax=Phascolarctobacterium faecium TaxID=33025 RepID=UPI003FD7E396
MIQINNKENCCGCRACTEICFYHAINMEIDEEGFYYPKVDSTKCIDCGLCDSVCPIMNGGLKKLDKNFPEGYVCWAKDKILRFNSTSGGIFGVLATLVINNNGVVYGAAFDEKMKLRVVKASNIEELQPILKSKYLQCNNEMAFKNIKKDLQEGKNVLYMSSPCNVKALKNYLRKKYDNLLTMDFICHGVPSQLLFDLNKSYLERKYNGVMLSYDFRDKLSKKPSPPKNRITFLRDKNTIEVSGLYLQDVFHCLFETFNILRPSCYVCRFAKPQRESDITVGDFHNINRYMPNINRFDGVSMMLVNTDLGNKFINATRNELFLKEFEVNLLISENECLAKPTRRKNVRNIIFKELNDFGFEYIAQKYVLTTSNKLKILYYNLPNWLRRILKQIVLR